MKKRIITLILCLMLVLTLCACGTAETVIVPSPTATPAVATTAPVSQPAEVSSTGRTIQPLPNGIDLSNPGDCVLNVGFDASDVYLEDGSKLVIKMSVFALELFDAVDVTTLQLGDTILIDGNPVLIRTLENNGTVSINGGVLNEGVTLAPGEGGTYGRVSENNEFFLSLVGELTVPVAQEFVFTDGTATQSPQTYLPGDFIALTENSNRVFPQNETTVHIADGWIYELNTLYIY